MIQRIQSLFLLIAAGVAIAINFLTIGDITIQTPEGFVTAKYTAMSLSVPGKIITHTFWIVVLWGASAILSLVTVFMFKKRLLQIRLNGVNMLVMLAALVTMLYIYPNMVFKMEVNFNNWILLSLLPAVCLFFANNFIKRDERRVRAADRLR